MNPVFAKICIFSITFLVLLFPGFSSGNGTTVTITNPLKYSTFPQLMDAIANFIFNIALAVAPIMIIIGAFYFVTSGGDPEKITTGKKIIIYTLIGLLIIILSKGLIAFFQKIF